MHHHALYFIQSTHSHYQLLQAPGSMSKIQLPSLSNKLLDDWQDIPGLKTYEATVTLLNTTCRQAKRLYAMMKQLLA